MPHFDVPHESLSNNNIDPARNSKELLTQWSIPSYESENISSPSTPTQNDPQVTLDVSPAAVELQDSADSSSVAVDEPFMGDELNASDPGSLPNQIHDHFGFWTQKLNLKGIELRPLNYKINTINSNNSSRRIVIHSMENSILLMAMFQ